MLQLVVASLLCVPGPTLGQDVDLRALAVKASGDSKTAMEKVQSVVSWTNSNFKWTATDNKRRTVQEVIARKGGNCNEQAIVVLALLDELGVETRKIREINLQPSKPSRQQSAEAAVNRVGLRGSVYGLNHNDHVWVEFLDGATGEWLPADPTLNLVGDQWIKARVGFDSRPTHTILPSRDMIVPIAIFAETGDGKLLSRAKHYLIEGFGRIYGSALTSKPAWADWSKLVAELEPLCQAAFEGKVNLHEHADRIVAIGETYRRLSNESEEGPNMKMANFHYAPSAPRG